MEETKYWQIEGIVNEDPIVIEYPERSLESLNQMHAFLITEKLAALGSLLKYR